MKRHLVAGGVGLFWSACLWGLSPADLADPAKALRHSKSPLALAEDFLVNQETAPVAAHREWLRGKGKTELAHKLVCLELLYQGDAAGALQSLALVQKKDPWTVERESFLTRLVEVEKPLVETKSDHFVVRTTEDQSFLAPYALSALEAAFGTSVQSVLSSSGAPVLVDLYSSVEDYAAAAQVSPSAVLSAGPLACFRYGRIRVLSPGATTFGYRWIDALVREWARRHSVRPERADAFFGEETETSAGENQDVSAPMVPSSTEGEGVLTYDAAASFVETGKRYFDEGRYEEAQTVLQSALEINPFNPAIHETLGLMAVDIGHFALARQSLELALRLDPTNGSIREALENMPKPR